MDGWIDVMMSGWNSVSRYACLTVCGVGERGRGGAWRVGR